MPASGYISTPETFRGHKSVRNTKIYINIEHALFQDVDDASTVGVVEKSEEVRSLMEAGFEYVCQKDNLIFLKKRK